MLKPKRVRSLVQEMVPERRVRTVFYLGTLTDGREVWAVNGNSNLVFAVALITENYEAELVL